MLLGMTSALRSGFTGMPMTSAVVLSWGGGEGGLSQRRQFAATSCVELQMKSAVSQGATERTTVGMLMLLASKEIASLSSKVAVTTPVKQQGSDPVSWKSERLSQTASDQDKRVLLGQSNLTGANQPKTLRRALSQKCFGGRSQSLGGQAGVCL